MKELSIEEKAKRYDEAIEIAKKINNEQQAQPFNVMTRVFPELTESEDEKVRKEIIYHIQNCDDTIDEETGKRMLDWLEKVGNIIKEWGDLKVRYIQDDLQEMVELKQKTEQGEQKQEWSEEDEDNFKHLMDEIVCLGNNRNSANRLYYDRLIKFIKELKNRTQPKEKWCDKDERMLDRLIAYFEKQVAFTDDDNPRYANWLKSLKDRVQPQPKQEWSEEDKIALGDALWCCKQAASIAKDENDMGNIWYAENWLKSLRPQNRWKPSDAQMASITCAVRKMKESACYDSELVSLLNDLKKL